MANEEQLQILKRGVEEWNKWREENLDVEANQEGADLMFAHLEGAELRKANLEGANLGYANLEGANLGYANLEGADLMGANLEGADLGEAHLEGAELRGVHLEGADLGGAYLEKANLLLANLEGADLMGANLEGADLMFANLEGADLRGCEGLHLDRTFIRNSQFDARAKDRWSVLRRKYTGPGLIFTLLFLFAFLVPFIAKTLGWVAFNRAQVQMDAQFNKLEQVAQKVETTHPNAAEAIRWVVESAEKKAKPESRVETRVWRLLIGVDQGWLYWGTALLIILFNLLRGLLTYVVSPMRDAEERSGWSPACKIQRRGEPLWKEPWRVQEFFGQLFEAYNWLWWPHKVVSALWYLSIGSFLFHAWQWLRLPVWVYR